MFAAGGHWDSQMNKQRINVNGIEFVLFSKPATINEPIVAEIELQEQIDLTSIESNIATLMDRPIYNPESIAEKFDQIATTFINNQARSDIADIRTTSIQLPFAVRVNQRSSWGGLSTAGIFWGDPTHAPLDESYDIWSIKVGRDDEEIDERFYHYGDVTDSSMRFATGWGAEGHRGWTWSTFGQESTAGPVMSLSQRGNLTIKGSVNVNDQILSGGTDIITLMGGSSAVQISSGFFDDTGYSIDNAAEEITVDEQDAMMWDNANMEGTLVRCTLPSATFSIPRLDTSYVVGTNTGSTPTFEIITNVDLINESDVIPFITLANAGPIVGHTFKLGWDAMAEGLPNKLHQRMVKTERFKRESGLILSEDNNRTIYITGGKLWNGANQLTIPAFDSSVNQTLFVVHVAGSTTPVTGETQWNNIQYDNGTDLVELGNNRWGVNWIYRMADEYDEHIAILLHNVELHDETAAILAQPPDPSTTPPGIRSNGILVGKIIFEKSATTGQTFSTFTSVFMGGSTVGASTDHNDLFGLQGGTTDEYYHFSSSQHEELLALIYAEPSFTSFTVDGHGSSQTIEVGDDFSSGSIDFTWGTNNSDNVAVNTIDIIDYDHSQIATSEANDGNFTFNYGAPLSHSNSTTRRWRILADNTNGAMFDRNIYVRWYWRYYWGSSASTTLDEAGIEGLQNNGLYDNENRTYTCNINNYKWICYPTSEGLAGGFTDADTGFAIAMESPLTVSITNSADNPTTTNYYAYRTSYSTASALNIIVG